MKDLDTLSPDAQGLVGHLEHAAQFAAAQRGAGYPQIHEDKVGGVEAAMPAIVELNEAGYHVSVSGGERDRMISLSKSDGSPIRVARPKQ